MALYRVDFSGRGELADRQQKLAQFLSKLQRLCEEYNLAVYMTNQMTADPGNFLVLKWISYSLVLSLFPGAGLSFGPTMKPVGGHILAHASATRIYLRKGKGDQRVAKICDSPEMPESEATFVITDGGIEDASHS